MGLVSSNKIETNKYELEISVDAADFEAAIQKIYLKQRNKINVNGFRKGKAPRNMIEKLYGANVFYEDAVNELVNDKVFDIIMAENYELVDQPDIAVTSISKEDGVNFKITVLVKPEVEISNYMGIEVTKTVNAVADEDVDKQIDAMRERNSRIITVDDRAAQNGDTAVIDFEGFKDGVAFEGGSEKNFDLVLGSGSFIPGFEDQIVGKNTGDEFTINVTFPENYQMPELAGAPAEFKIKLNEIKSKELPELDDEFVKDASEFDTVDELKADLKAKLVERAEASAKSEAENAVFEKLAELMTAEIPEVMYENKVAEMVRDFEMRIGQQGLNLEMYLMYTNMTEEAFRDGFKPQAEMQVKIRLALEKIAVLENITVADEAVDEEVNKIAAAYQITAEKVRSIVSDKSIKSDLIVDAASKLVLENAKING